MNDHDVIVAGGGIAGLTCAAYLCRAGHGTLLCERSGHIGGLVRTFRRDGFAFDAGIRAFENSGIVFPMLKSLGLDLTFVQNTVSIVIGDQLTRFDGGDGLARYMAMLGRLFPENAAELALIEREIRAVIGYMDVLYGIDNPLFMEKPDREYLTKTLLPWLLRYQVNIRKAGRLTAPIRSHLRRFTRNEALIDMLAQHFFAETPAFFALSYFGQYTDYSYPLGGTGMLSEALARYIGEHGGHIMTETAVTGVESHRHEVLTARGDVFRYRKLVWAADQKLLYTALTPGLNAAAENQRALVGRSGGGDSVFAVYLGVELSACGIGDLPGPHVFYTPSTLGLSSLPDWRGAAGGGTEALFGWVSSYLERTTYEISFPALRDPTLAPGGKLGVSVSTLMDAALVRHVSEVGAYAEFKLFCTEKITARLEALLPGLGKGIVLALSATPLTIERETGNSDGAITGWAFTNSPSPAENRFKKIARSIRTPVADVSQCGQWTFSPSGMPISILTGKLAADAIGKDLRKR